MAVVVSVPALPGAHARAMTLLLEQDASLSELAAVIESDPGLTAGVLRAANSALSKPAAPVARVADALVCLGFRATRALVVATLLRSQVDDLRGSGLDLEQLCRHLIATGLLANAAATTQQARAAAFTAGMLHDVGRLALAAAAPEDYARVMRLVEDGLETLDAERRIFGTDHIETGLVAAGSWSLPGNLSTAIACHHQDSADPLVSAIVTGRRIAGALGYGDGVLPPGDERLVLPPCDDDVLVLGAVGGPQELARRIEWFRGALAAA